MQTSSFSLVVNTFILGNSSGAYVDKSQCSIFFFADFIYFGSVLCEHRYSVSVSGITEQGVTIGTKS